MNIKLMHPMVSISTGPLLGEYSVTGEFCRQKADNTEFLFLC